MSNSKYSFNSVVKDGIWSQSITANLGENAVDLNNQTGTSYRQSSIFDVARYILHTLGSMTTMKLQKLAYYCQAWSLAWDEEPLFNEDFQAWANGPVCPELYNAHKGRYYISESDLMIGNTNCFTDEQIESMNIVIEAYGDKTPQWLSELIHKERPWLETRGKTPMGEWCDNTISKESMQDYYAGLIR